MLEEVSLRKADSAWRWCPEVTSFPDVPGVYAAMDSDGEVIDDLDVYEYEGDLCVFFDDYTRGGTADGTVRDHVPVAATGMLFLRKDKIAPPGEDADPTEFVERTAQRSGGASC